MKTKHKFLFRLSRVVLWVAATFGSLLAFPSAIPWMIIGWLVWIAILYWQYKTVWPAVAVCLTVLMVKQPGWSISLVLFLLVGVVYLFVLVRKFPTRIRLALLGLWFGLFAWYAIQHWLDANCSQQYSLLRDRLIVCLGDSLTEGGYPRTLQDLVSVPVIDFGRDGITTQDAIRDLLPEIEMLQPQAVIVELGGHDFNLEKRSRADTRNSLVEIIQRLESAGAVVVLVEIPRGFIRDPYAGIERDLCREFDLQLVPDTPIRRFIFWGPYFPPGSWVDPAHRLSEDGLHPNEHGDRLFAEYICRALAKIYGNQILKE